MVTSNKINPRDFPFLKLIRLMVSSIFLIHFIVPFGCRATNEPADNSTQKDSMWFPGVYIQNPIGENGQLFIE